jgi:hypothetical protein
MQPADVEGRQYVCPSVRLYKAANKGKSSLLNPVRRKVSVWATMQPADVERMQQATWNMKSRHAADGSILVSIKTFNYIHSSTPHFMIIVACLACMRYLSPKAASAVQATVRGTTQNWQVGFVRR